MSESKKKEKKTDKSFFSKNWPNRVDKNIFSSFIWQKTEKIQNSVISGFFHEFWLFSFFYCMNEEICFYQLYWANFWKENFCQFRYFLIQELFLALYLE